ncbi:MAG: hypothetical protein Q7S15_01840 [bacterium]|nr:hypothetical protein [bacterium]
MKFLISDGIGTMEGKVRLIPIIEKLTEIVRSKTYEVHEASVMLPFDEVMREEVLRLGEELSTPKQKYVILIGIGGSNLGVKAVYDALRGYYDLLEENHFPKIIFLDTLQATYAGKVLNLLKSHSPEELLIIIASKSGTTTETAVNAELTLAALGTAAHGRVVAITDEASALWQAAKDRGFKILTVPRVVGGRFSVFSPVGLFPLTVAGFDIEAFTDGAKLAFSNSSIAELPENFAMQSALYLYEAYEKGIRIHDLFLFNPALESLGKWYRQLVAESLGKEKSNDGSIVNAGITPTVSIGSNDLHSMVELYLGGPRDKITTFVSAPEIAALTIPSELNLPTVPMVAGKSVGEVLSAIYEGTKAAYRSKGLPHMELVFDGVSEKELGYFMQHKMVETIFLGELLGINAFNQPSVELYKQETRKILST